MGDFIEFLVLIGIIATVVRLARRKAKTATTTTTAQPPLPRSVPRSSVEREEAEFLRTHVTQEDVERLRPDATQDRASRDYQGISRPQPKGVFTPKQTKTRPLIHSANAPKKAALAPDPEVREAMREAAEAAPERAMTAEEEFCAVPEAHSHKGPELDEMQTLRREVLTPRGKELRKAVVWAEILGSRGGRQKTCRL